MAGELCTSASINGEFQSGDAAKTPDGIGDGLHEIGFTLPDRLELPLISVEKALIFGGIVAGEEDGAAG